MPEQRRLTVVLSMSHLATTHRWKMPQKPCRLSLMDRTAPWEATQKAPPCVAGQFPGERAHSVGYQFNFMYNQAYMTSTLQTPSVLLSNIASKLWQPASLS